MTEFFWLFLIVFHLPPQRPIPPQPPRYTCCAPPKRHTLPEASR